LISSFREGLANGALIMDQSYFGNGKNAATGHSPQCPQEGAQLVAAQDVQLDFPPANADISLITFLDLQDGQHTRLESDPDMTRVSNFLSHFLQ